MEELWSRTFELFRRHLVLWVPCSVAGVLALWLGELERAENRWLVGLFATHHSVLGGKVPSADFAEVQHRAIMVSFPSAFLKYLIEVSLFVLALAATKNLVCMILNEQRPGMVSALRSFLPRFPEVLLFSLKYVAVLAIFGGALLVMGSSPLTPDHIQEVALFKAFIYLFALLAQGCLAWLLLPAAMRLLQPPGTMIISKGARRLGTAFAVASSGCALLIGYVLGKAESLVIFDKQWESHAIAVMNTVLVNTPQILLFIALALLTMEVPGDKDESSLSEAPETL